MDIKLIFDILHFLFAILACLLNGILLILFAKHPELRNVANKRTQILLIVSDFLFGLSSIVIDIESWRIKYIDQWYTAAYCLTLFFPSLFSGILCVFVVFLLSVERLLALCAPVQYRQAMQRNGTFYVILAIAIIPPFVYSCFSFYGVDFSLKPDRCGGAGTRIPALKPMMSYFNFAAGTAVVLVYSAILILLLAKQRHQRVTFISRSSNSSANRTRVKVFSEEVEATKVILVIAIGCLLGYILPNLVLTVLTSRGILNSSDIGRYVALCAICNCSLNVLIFLWKDRKMRRAFRSLFFAEATTAATESSELSAGRSHVNCGKSLETPLSENDAILNRSTVMDDPENSHVIRNQSNLAFDLRAMNVSHM